MSNQRLWIGVLTAAVHAGTVGAMVYLPRVSSELLSADAAWMTFAGLLVAGLTVRRQGSAHAAIGGTRPAPAQVAAGVAVVQAP